MKFILILLSFCSFFSYGQTYWQQEVDYTINVSLDDKNHVLRGSEEFTYSNNSPDQLNRLYIHIWPNAYKDKNTALAKQQYQGGDGNGILRFGPDEHRGNIDSLDFKVNGETANWHFHHHEDIAIIELTNPLEPGGKLTVTTPFRVKIPSGAISRLGHIGQSYQITQWYPKPAVYDKNGWHHMPYLNQGEFYSEYGSFDVSITLPENYVVGATGDLQTQSELEFLDRKALHTAEELANDSQISKTGKSTRSNKTPESSSKLKTIRYTQSNVHDFAWFADKRYMVLKGQVDLPHSKRRVTSWAMFTPKNCRLWKDALEYINDGAYYYSLWNGDYPYNQVTAVDGTISAGGGMEYPNITVIGNASKAYELEVVIVHEVGHNWFYGQLGTNERVHGWMDEGMNTLNEVRYMQTKYPNNTALSDMVLDGKFHFNDLSHQDMSDMAYRAIAGLGEDQPIETHSNDFSSANYGIVMYQKTGLVFFYLKDYLGEELFDKCMQAYYREWEFKHPQPEDMRAVLERESQKDLSWLFDDLIKTTNHVDYKLAGIKKHDAGFDVTVKNVGQVDGPIEVATMMGDSVVETKWAEPGEKKTTLHFKEGFSSVRIDPGRDIPEINRQNNGWRKKGMFGKIEKPVLEFLFGDNEEDATNIFWTPTIGGNYYDKFMLGVAVHNYSAPTSKVNYLFMPYYSFGRQFVSGISEISIVSQPKRTFKLSRFGVSIKSFKNDTVYRHNDSYYISVAPYWMAKIGNRGNNTPVSQYIRVQSIYKKDKYGPTHIEHAGAYAEYNLDFSKRDHKFNMNLRNEYITNVNTSDEMARILLEVNYSYRYKKEEGRKLIQPKSRLFSRASKAAKGWVSIRGFVGKQYLSDFDKAVNGYQYSMSLSGTDGKQDLFVDEYYFGRNNLDGIWSQQREENMGGFKSTSYYGTTSDLMTTANLYVQLPIKPGIFGLYADVGAFWNDIGPSTGSSVKVNTAANLGAAIRFGEFFGVYFPIWMSKELNDSFGNSDYASKIRFSLKMNLFNAPLSLKGIL